MTLDYESRFKAIIAKNKIYGIEDRFFDLSKETGASVPSWVEGQTLYEVFVRNFSSSVNFDGVRRRLQTIKDLGVNILWLMPIYPIGQLKRKGLLGSPYAVRDFYAVNPEYGSKQDFKSLVEDIHALDMRVIIDMVPNHVAPDYVELTKHPELLRRNSRGEPDRLISDWTDIVDLDYTSQSTRKHTLDIMQYWISEFAIDGYRVDVAGMVPLEFWEWAIPQLRQIKPELYLLAEWESPLLHRVGFTSTYDWTWHSLMLKVLKGRESAAIL
jgi:cyclomaltodextrinase / maltogenic alpha-amylase / neopullulanase